MTQEPKKTPIDKTIGTAKPAQFVAEHGVNLVLQSKTVTPAQIAELERDLGPTISKLLKSGKEGLVQIKVSPEKLAKIHGRLEKAGWVLSVLEGAYEIHKEDGTTHKLQRTAAVVAENLVGTLPGVLTSTGVVANTAIGGGALTAGAATGVAAAAVIVPAVAAYIIKADAEVIIETSRLYEKTEKTFKPDMKNLSNLLTAEKMLEPKLKKLGATYVNGRVDYSVGTNRYHMEKAISEEVTRLKDVMEKNDSALPRTMAFTAKQAEMHFEYHSAKEDLRRMQSASTELNQLREKYKSKKLDLKGAQASNFSLGEVIESNGPDMGSVPATASNEKQRGTIS